MTKREIKFRAWDKEEKKMWAWGNIQIASPIGDSSKTVVYIRIGQECLPCPELILMQYTGLKDKNGKEIYEGDILLLGTMTGAANSLLPGRYWIEYFCDGFKLTHKSFGETMYRNAGEFPCGTTEVIGNVYETPELLEKQ